jgi:hypothetical protein
MKAVFHVRCTEVIEERPEETGLVLASARLDEEPPVKGLDRTVIIVAGPWVLGSFRVGGLYPVFIGQEESAP